MTELKAETTPTIKTPWDEQIRELEDAKDPFYSKDDEELCHYECEEGEKHV